MYLCGVLTHGIKNIKKLENSFKVYKIQIIYYIGI